jgi:hypothetical protein
VRGEDESSREQADEDAVESAKDAIEAGLFDLAAVIGPPETLTYVERLAERMREETKEERT